MTTAFANDDFLIAPEDIKKEIIEIDEEEIEINMNEDDDGIGGGDDEDEIEDDADGSYFIDEIGFDPDKMIKDDPGDIIDGNGGENAFDRLQIRPDLENGVDENGDGEEEDDTITREDVEAIHERLEKANKIVREEITELKKQLDEKRRQSIVYRRSALKEDIDRLIKQRVWLEEQNEFLKKWCLHECVHRFQSKMKTSLNHLEETIKSDVDYIVKSKSNLDDFEDPGSTFRSEKFAQTIRTMACKGSEKTEELKDDFISHLRQRNSDLKNKLDKERLSSSSTSSSFYFEAPDVLLVKKDDYLKVLEKSRSSRNLRTSLTMPTTKSDCDPSKIVKKDQSINLKVKFDGHFQVSLEPGKKKPPAINGPNVELRRQFYICKCGQKFSKNTLGYKAAYDSFRKHVARCSVYMKDGAVCDICDAPFHSIPCLKVHIRRIHPERPELLEKYRHVVSCPCGKIFDNYSQECTAIKALRKHARTCPSYRSKAIFCYICKEPFLEKNQLNNHIRMAHTMTPNGISGKSSSSTVSKTSTASNATSKRKKLT